MKLGLTQHIEAEIHAINAIMRESIELIIKQANWWAIKGHSEIFIERAIELALEAAETELRTTFTPEFSASIAAEIRQVVEAETKVQPGGASQTLSDLAQRTG
jgi:hypothetical protein